MTPRKIALCPRVGYLIAMPESYDPEIVTREDVVADCSLVYAATELAPLRKQSKSLWDMAVETADGDHAREEMSLARARSLTLWDDAMQAIDRQDIDGAREALEAARVLAAEGGDDGPERDALAMLGTRSQP